MKKWIVVLALICFTAMSELLFLFVPLKIEKIVNLILLIILFLVVTFIMLKHKKAGKKMVDQYKSLENQVKDYLEVSKKSFDVFSRFYDNSFLLIKNIFVNLDPDEQQSKIDYIERLRNNNSIKKFLETDETPGCGSRDFELLKQLNRNKEIAMEYINISTDMENELFNELSLRVDVSYKKESFQKMVTEYDYYSKILKELLHASIVNINKSSGPLSSEIYEIKKEVNTFLKDLSEWKDITNEKSENNFQRVINRYEDQNREIVLVSDIINENHKSLCKRLNEVSSGFEKIYENTSSINDISETVRLLSINASIEAAKAGEFGKGFKVIAAQVQKLSNNVQQVIKNINQNVMDTRQSIEIARKDFDHTNDILSGKVSVIKQEFGSFYKILNVYNDDFNKIYKTISNITGQITDKVNKISPIFQMHDITIQQMYNISKMFDGFLSDNKAVIDAILLSTPAKMREKILYHLFELIMSKITTDIEIDVINDLTQKLGLKQTLQKGKEMDAIELF